MKKIVLVPDSFKGTMSSLEICGILREAILKYDPGCEVVSLPVADGGEGSVDAFLAALGGEKIECAVTGPYGEPLTSFYGLLPGGVAVVEMAAAAGLPLVGENRKAQKTTTYGVGQLIAAAAGRDIKKLLIGLGGSATNDGGAGAAAALGVRFFNAAGAEFVPVGETLEEIERVDAAKLLPALRDIEIVTMCDIDNPLCGPNGAAAVFGPQKGADAKTIERLDAGLRHLSEIVRRDLGADILELPGAGAAGGMGGGTVAFFGARLSMGIDAVLDTVDFARKIKGAGLVITGEGKIDAQSLRGKVVVGVARRAKKSGVPVVAIVGDIADGAEAVFAEGVSGIFSINRVAIPFERAKERAKNDLRLTAENLVHCLRALGH